MNKKHIQILIALGGAAVLAVGFAFVWLTMPKKTARDFEVVSYAPARAVPIVHENKLAPGFPLELVLGKAEKTVESQTAQATQYALHAQAGDLPDKILAEYRALLSENGWNILSERQITDCAT